MNEKQQLATLIQAAIDAGKTNNLTLINMAVSALGAKLETLPDNWTVKPETAESPANA